jgi:putative ABC transport system permease protein
MLKLVARRLKRSPLFTAVTILTLALGIGANTAVFTVVHSVLLKPLAFHEPDRLIGVWQSAPGVGIKELNASPGTYFTYREESKTFEDIAVWRTESVNITGTAEPERIQSIRTTFGLLPVLRVQPVLGRNFTSKDDSPGQPETVMLSYGYWQRKFGGDPGVLGKRILIDSTAHEVIGILPEQFRFVESNPSVLLPMRFDRASIRLGNFSYRAVARLKPGVTMAEAHADVARMLPIMMRKFPPPPGMSLKMMEDARIAPNLHSLKDDYIGDIGNILWVLMAMIGIVLLVACANVANLFLVRVESREREISVRSALGATRLDLAKDLLLESGLLGIAGGMVGGVFAYGAIELLKALSPPYLPRLEEITIDANAILFTAVVSLLTGLLLGLIPVWKQAGKAVNESLRSGGRTMSEGREKHFARNVLVVVQIGLAVVLLAGAGLMIRTMSAMTKVDPGFSKPEAIQTFRVSIPESLVPGTENLIRSFDSIASKLSALPGVQTVGLSNSVSMDRSNSNDPIFVEGRNYRDGEIPTLRREKNIGPNYFKAMGNPLKAGRDMDWKDIYAIRPVVLVSENLAVELWGSPTAALGKRLRESPQSIWHEVIGVAGDERDDGVDQPAPKIVYWPMVTKQLDDKSFNLSRSLGVVVRTERAGTESLLTEIRQAVWSVNPNLPLANPRTQAEVYARSMARTSFTLTMLSIAAGLALALGVIGIYAVISYTVSQRKKEIGIRLALGSPEASVRDLFLLHGLKLAAIGIACGLAVAIPLSKLMSALLFEVNPLDPFTYVIVASALIVSAALAAYVPAVRATKVSPLESLSA